MPATVVHFVSGVADPLTWAERAVRRAHAKRFRLWVTGPERELRGLAQRLCTAEPLGFLPMAGPQAAEAVRQRSALQFHDATQVLPVPPAGTRLLNLGAAVTERFKAFDEVLDCAPVDASALDAARQRFRGYQDLGLNVQHTKSRGVTS